MTTRPDSIPNQLAEQNKELLNKIFKVKMELLSLTLKKMPKEVKKRLLKLLDEIE